MRTNRLSVKILALLFACLTLLLLASCGPTAQTEPTAAKTTAETAAEPAKYTVRLNAPASTAIHTALQARYLADSDVFSVLTYADKEGKEELSRPTPITLTWETETDLRESDIREYRIRIWVAANSAETVEATVPGSETEYAFYNARVGTKYRWTVTAVDGDGKTYPSATAVFTTVDGCPRNLYVDGITNVRDVGGWKTLDGGRVRQGLLFRGSKLAANKNAKQILITEKGIATLRDELGVRSEIDLRLETQLGGLTSSPLGNTVNFYSRPMEDDYNTMFTTASNLQNVRAVFALLADESNYPIYFHCSIGADRTGLIAWLVNGLCGVSEDDLWRDHLFTNFGEINATRTTGIRKAYVNKLESAPGDTFADQIYNYLKNTVGVPESDLQAVVRIMKEPAAK